MRPSGSCHTLRQGKIAATVVAPAATATAEPTHAQLLTLAIATKWWQQLDRQAGYIPIEVQAS